MIALASVLAALAGFVLGTLGGGGSILIVPILLYVAGLPADQAITGSLVVVAIASALGAARHARHGHVHWRTGLALGMAGMLGSLAGGLAAHQLPPRVLLLGFIAMMIAAAVAMLRGAPTRPRGDRLGVVLAIGLVVGAVTGLVGAGGGFLVVPALVLFGGLGVRDAAGTSLVVIALQATAGLAGHLAYIAVPWMVVVPITGAAGLGVVAGARASSFTSPVVLRRSFAGLVLAIAAVMLAAQLAGS